MSRLLDNLLIFGGILRRAGVDVHAGRLADLAQALGFVDLGAQEEVYHACRALLVRRLDQIAIFDLAFAAFWRAHHERQPAQTGSTSSTESRASVVETLDVLAPEDDDEAAGA